MSFMLESPAFDEGGQIPTRFTCDGQNVSPPLRWEGEPDNTQSFALIVDDPDAPRRTFTHWVLFDVPASLSELAEGTQAGDVGTAGTNDFGKVGYGGPCPPPSHGPHRYFFTLYALDQPALGLTRGAGRDAVERAITGHTLARAQLMGRHERQ
ncbi:MAG TPA: YbhB/YbcL family Raf kinase inhibitor-like protein [Chloroflexi bacterium]|nr:YbhB/YbcL family Raf kinase inhibitor-like protein [Chloroflexota bacterium]